MKKSKRGGSRPNAGRKPLHGETKIDRNIALTPQAWAFLVSGGKTAGEEMETRTRASKEFKAWLRKQ